MDLGPFGMKLFILVWSSWGAWITCSATACGGQQSRTRNCSSCGDPSDDCDGTSSESQECNIQEHPGKLVLFCHN